MKSLDKKTAKVIQDLFINKKITSDQAIKLIKNLTKK
jgi:hypothetical protein